MGEKSGGIYVNHFMLSLPSADSKISTIFFEQGTMGHFIFVAQFYFFHLFIFPPPP